MVSVFEMIAEAKIYYAITKHVHNIYVAFCIRGGSGIMSIRLNYFERLVCSICSSVQEQIQGILSYEEIGISRVQTGSRSTNE
jgi:hypothetical protein